MTVKTKHLTALASVMTVAGLIIVAYFGGDEETPHAPLTAGRAVGYCDVYYLQESRPRLRDVVPLAELPDGRSLWTARLRGEDSCANAPSFGEYIGSTPDEARAHPKLADKFAPKPIAIGDQTIEISELPTQGDLHNWCCP
ncbi:MAG: hypothetical protein Kow0090_08880 [Myxococcota bacterium]